MVSVEGFNEHEHRPRPLPAPEDEHEGPRCASPGPGPAEGQRQGEEGLWAQCDNCESMQFVRFLKQRHRVCEACGYHLEMNSTERIELLIDSGTWQPMNDSMVSIDVLEFVDEQAYEERLDETQMWTGLTDAVQTGIGNLSGTPVALGVMDFQFMGGAWGLLLERR